jgi:hypothetical protein
VLWKHEECDRRVLASDGRDHEHVEDLVESEVGRVRVGPAERVDERADRVQDPAGQHEQRGSDSDLGQQLRETATPIQPSATPITAEIHFGASRQFGEC